MLTEIILSGFGGQGLLFAGKNLAYCAMSKEKEITWLPSYGPEMRGGTAYCSVCISDEPVGSPYISHPDILVVMNEPSFTRFEPTVRSGGVMYVDSSMTAKRSARDDIECVYIPATELAAEHKLGGMANIILLGSIAARYSDRLLGIGTDDVINAFSGIIPQSRSALIEKNIEALKLGMGI